MQILGKRSKVLLIVISVVMLVSIGVSFATWDVTAVKAANANSSTYANAKVGDIIEFGQYYQTGNRVGGISNAEYEKTPIEWIVVDKDERAGQLTLMSKYILAAGSYFGNYYANASGSWGYNYKSDKAEIAGIQFNQAYLESTARAFLNNLERKDLGGDSYNDSQFYTSTISSVTTENLYSSVGFSNRTHRISGVNYKRPIESEEYINRPATLGFYDESFTADEKALIVPKVIPGYTGYRWPDNDKSNHQNVSYVEGMVDKVWLASATELNSFISNAERDDVPSDEASSTVFEYFKNFNKYKNPFIEGNNTSLADALKTTGTSFVKNDSKAINYSIPVYMYQSTAKNEDISTSKNSGEWYWTRSAVSSSHTAVRYVNSLGAFENGNTDASNGGARPCIILKY